MNPNLPLLTTLPSLAHAIRTLAMDAVEQAQSGHPGMPMGMADVATVLYARHLKFWAHNPHWPDRDRFILSAGHGSMLLYALSYLTGYEGMTMEQIKKFRQLGSRTPGHPEHDVDVGIEMTTGPLGQGIATSVGFARAEKLNAERFGSDLVNHHTYVMAGDGDMQEGINHEACALAGHWNLNKLIVLYDDNGITIDGPTHLSFTEDVCKRYTAYGFITRQIDGHDMTAIDDALTWAKIQNRPVLIACKTIIGKFAGKKEGTADCHGSPLGPDGIAAARTAMKWPQEPFIIPDDILSTWRAIGMQGRTEYTSWEKRLSAVPDQMRQDFITAQSGISPLARTTAINLALAQINTQKQTIATRKASQMVLEHLVSALPNLIGGSADLTGSNLTKVTAHSLPEHPYIHYGIREHGMAAIMNGLSLHGGMVPYGGTFLCFADYMRPAMRLAALMGTQVIYVMTHDSIGLGEDGPTHQPIEHLASLRAIPNMLVLRPADAQETAVCWDIALAHKTGPSVIALSRQNIPPLPILDLSEIKNGGYVMIDTPSPSVVLCATGTEVDIAIQTAHLLTTKYKIATRVLSVPCFELFMSIPHDIRSTLIPINTLHVGIEAGIRQGWDEIIGSNGLFFGLNTFGASGKYKDIYAHFGLTPEYISSEIIKKLSDVK